MLRLWLLLFLAAEIFACQGSNNSCVQKIIDANAIQGKILSLPVRANKRVLFSSTKPNAIILKADPFLGLYLIDDLQKFPYDFEFNTKLKLPNAVVDTKGYMQGQLQHRQVGLSQLGTFSKPHRAPALLLNSCCYLYGLVTPNGIIEKEYIEHFLSSRGGIYGDIGVRLNTKKRGVFVEAADPFFTNNPFKKEDQLLSFDGEKLIDAADAMRKILFAPIGSRHTLRVKRGAKIFDVSVVVAKRYGGGLVSDTFLESRGIMLSKSLTIESLSQKFKNYGLKEGDKLLWVNGTAVHSQQQLRNYLQDSKDFSSLLFERDGFQFFVNLK